MKKILIGCLVIVAGVAAFAGGPISFGLTNDSQMLLPARSKYYSSANVTSWAETNIYYQGQLIENTNQFYMVMTAGTNAAGTNAPSHTWGEGTDGTLQYYRVPSGLRKGLAIVNDSTVDINLSIGTPAVINKGITLKANGGSYSLDNSEFQGAVYGIAQSAGSNNVTVVEVD